MGALEDYEKSQDIAKDHPGNHDPFHNFVMMDGRITYDAERIITAGLQLLQHALHQTARAHGWWEDGSRNMGEMIALMHSELSEGLESYRNNEPNLWFKHKDGTAEDSYVNKVGELGKPEGISSEFADTIIRIFDTAEHDKIPVIEAIMKKHNYNITRPYRHGGKKA